MTWEEFKRIIENQLERDGQNEEIEISYLNLVTDIDDVNSDPRVVAEVGDDGLHIYTPVPNYYY